METNNIHSKKIVGGLMASFGWMLAGLICAAGLGLVAKYMIQHRLRFGQWFGHSHIPKDYQYNKWAREQNEQNDQNEQNEHKSQQNGNGNGNGDGNNGNDKYDELYIHESLIDFYNCIRDWNLQGPIAQGELSHNLLEYQYELKKKQLEIKYYGYKGYEGYEGSPAQQHKWLDLLNLEKDKRTLITYVDILQPYAVINVNNKNLDIKKFNNNNGRKKRNDNNDNPNFLAKLWKKWATNSNDKMAKINFHKNSDTTNDKIHRNNSIDSTKVHSNSISSTSASHSDANATITILVGENENDNAFENENKVDLNAVNDDDHERRSRSTHKLEEKKQDDDTRLIEITKEIFEEFSKWDTAFEDLIPIKIYKDKHEKLAAKREVDNASGDEKKNDSCDNDNDNGNFGGVLVNVAISDNYNNNDAVSTSGTITEKLDLNYKHTYVGAVGGAVGQLTYDNVKNHNEYSKYNRYNRKNNSKTKPMAVDRLQLILDGQRQSEVRIADMTYADVCPDNCNYNVIDDIIVDINIWFNDYHGEDDLLVKFKKLCSKHRDKKDFQQELKSLHKQMIKMKKDKRNMIDQEANFKKQILLLFKLDF